MARVSGTTNTSLIKGLITEASLLNFPEGASVDELNMDINRTGIREPRKGIEFDSAGSLSSYTHTSGQAVNEGTWDNVSGASGLQFLVIQIGSTIRFYDKSSSPLSDGEKSFTINLSTYSAANDYIVSEERVSMQTVGAYLIICSRAIETLIVKYDDDADSITVTEMAPKIRDYEWQGDTSGYFEPTLNPSAARQYDTFNAGWVSTSKVVGASSGDGVLDKYQTGESNQWPPLNVPWFVGKDSVDNDEFKSFLFNRFQKGTTLISNGHFILDLYNQKRADAYNNHHLNTETPITTGSVPDVTYSDRISCVAGYAGRAFFSGISNSDLGSKVYFSRIIKEIEDIGEFYSINDPTHEDLSDVLDSDGGVIDIPQASRITALFEFGSALLVFAENGVWEIKGVDNVFKATEFSVSRVSGTDGLYFVNTLIDVEGVPFWWGTYGIYTIQSGNALEPSSGVDITKATIQTFWENIGTDFRSEAKGVYDPLNKRAYWLYSDDNSFSYKYNKILIYDVVLQAFVPWSITDEASSTNYIVGGVYRTGLGTVDTTLDIVSNSNNVVSDGNEVVSTQSQDLTSNSGFQFIIRDGDTGTIGFGGFTNSDYKDWGTRDYDAYIEMPYIFDGNISTRKKNLYVTPVFERTEDGFTGSTPNYTATNQSKCTMKIYWEGNSTSSSSKEVYKLRRLVTADENDLSAFNYPYDTVVTRNRVRGRGRWCKIRFQNTPGYQFKLIGVEVLNLANQGV